MSKHYNIGNKHNLQNIFERFESKIFYSPDGCWYWTASQRGNQVKYGCILFQSKIRSAHRVSYSIYKGDIPKGLFVCHSCDNGLCVNPNHLWLGTRQDNIDDCVSKGRKKMSEDQKQKLSSFRKGKKMSEETKKKISIATSGVNNPNWKHGLRTSKANQ